MFLFMQKKKESVQLVASAKFSSTTVERPGGAAPDTVNVSLLGSYANGKFEGFRLN